MTTLTLPSTITLCILYSVKCCRRVYLWCYIKAQNENNSNNNCFCFKSCQHFTSSQLFSTPSIHPRVSWDCSSLDHHCCCQCAQFWSLSGKNQEWSNRNYSRWNFLSNRWGKAKCSWRKNYTKGLTLLTFLLITYSLCTSIEKKEGKEGMESQIQVTMGTTCGEKLWGTAKRTKGWENWKKRKNEDEKADIRYW